MKSEPVSLFDDQKVGAIAEIISKYNLLAVPVLMKIISFREWLWLMMLLRT